MRITMFGSARRELMARMAQVALLAIVLIVGPMAEDSRAPTSIEEAWMLERLYGPPQQWVIDVVPEHALATLAIAPGERLHLETVADIRIAVLTSKTVDHLGIELIVDQLRVYEIDA